MKKLKELLKSRKALLLIAGIVYAVLTFLKDQVGISLDPAAVVGTLAMIAIYLFGEARADMARVKQKIFQEAKWKDPKFWMALVGVLIPVISEFITFPLPVEIINTVLAAILGLLFKVKK
jgi:arginine exporter protein ArgO